MAYAAIAGFNPVAGLYAGVVPAIVGSLTAHTVLMVTTLTSAIALTSQSVLSDAGLDPQATGNIATLTLLAGLVMPLMRVLRLGDTATPQRSGTRRSSPPAGRRRGARAGRCDLLQPHGDGPAGGPAARLPAGGAAVHPRLGRVGNRHGSRNGGNGVHGR
ncbi:SulP family inorganic anion transporter [Streptomyces sp. NPDC059352]|uniref:SulP family inorganic anion transporter n=1 Tax=Streptomyces sp. NPDC059352 TaxID=3346810 RepID=UPI0036899D60